MKKLLIILILFCSLQGFGQIKGYWRLNGDSNDASGNGYNGTDANMTYPQGLNKLSGSFNGTSSSISLGTANLLPAGTGTVSVWTKGITGANASNHYLITKGSDAWPTNNWGLDVIPISSAGKNMIALLYGVGSWLTVEISTSVFDLSKWHHIVAVMRSNATQSIYLDGKLVASGTSAVKIPNAAHGMWIGRTDHPSTNRYWINGYLDDVIIDISEWSAARVKNEYIRMLGAFSN